MAKDLTWFKFNPSNWMMGRIQRQSDSVQVSFMRLICNYWHNQCSLSIEEAELECGDEAFSILLKNKLILINGDNISIKFLDEQFHEIQVTKQQNSIAGKISAEVRRSLKNVEQNTTTVNDSSTTVQRNLTDKNKSKNKSKIKDIDKSINIPDAEASDVFNSCKKMFIDFYKSAEHTEYYFTAKDAAKLKSLIKKIELKVKEKNSGQKESSEVIRGFDVFIRQAYTGSDKWIQQNFSLSTLDSKFNEIFIQLKNGKVKTHDKFEKLNKAYQSIENPFKKPNNEELTID